MVNRFSIPVIITFCLMIVSMTQSISIPNKIKLKRSADDETISLEIEKAFGNIKIGNHKSDLHEVHPRDLIDDGENKELLKNILNDNDNVIESEIHEHVVQKADRHHKAGDEDEDESSRAFKQKRETDLEKMLIPNGNDLEMTMNDIEVADKKLFMTLINLRNRINKTLSDLLNVDNHEKKIKKVLDAKTLIKTAKQLVNKAELESIKRHKRHSNTIESYKICMDIDMSDETTNECSEDGKCKQSVNEIKIRTENDNREAHSQPIYLLKALENNSPATIKKTLRKLYNAVDNLQKQGNDVIFMPIRKGSATFNDAKKD